MKSQAALDRERIAEADDVRAARQREWERQEARPRALGRIGVKSAAITHLDRLVADYERTAAWLTRQDADAEAELGALRTKVPDYWESRAAHARREELLARREDIARGYDVNRSSDLRELAEADGIELRGGTSLPGTLRRIEQLRAEREPFVWALEEAQAALARLESED